MRVVCMIDSLNSGGAQRQMVMLSTQLKTQGADVHLLTYHEKNFFRDQFDQAGIPVHLAPSTQKLKRFFQIRKKIRSLKPDVVVAYLKGPGFVAELSGLPWRKYKVIVSERSTEYSGKTPEVARRLFFHRLADAVVCNAETQTRFIKEHAPNLSERTVTIRNAVDLNTFTPANHPIEAKRLRLLALGRYLPLKNPQGLYQAFKLAKQQKPELDLSVDWFGNFFFKDDQPTPKSKLYLDLKEEVAADGYSEDFRMHPPTSDVVEHYQQADAVCHPSLWEACPNVVCEALACGKPVLAGRVGDTEQLMQDGVTGFLFDPKSPERMAQAFLRFSDLSTQAREAMGNAARLRAEELFSIQRFSAEYIDLFHRLLNRKGEIHG